jgi:hypothetical protein
MPSPFCARLTFRVVGLPLAYLIAFYVEATIDLKFTGIYDLLLGAVGKRRGLFNDLKKPF